MPGRQQHRRYGAQPGNGGNQQHLCRAQPRHALNDLRQPGSEPDAVRDVTEKDDRKHHHLRISQCLPDAQLRLRLLALLIAFELADDPLPFVRSKPARVFRTVVQVEERDDSRSNGREPFQDQQPTPASHPKPVEAHQASCNRRADHVRRWNRRHEHRNRLASVLLSVPIREIHEDAREEAGLRNPQQKPHPVEFGGGIHESAEHGHQAPGHQAERNEASRTPQLDQQR